MNHCFLIGLIDGEVVWGAPHWIMPAALIAGVLAMLVLWSYARPLMGINVRVAAGILKLAAIVLLALCLLEPMRTGRWLKAFSQRCSGLGYGTESRRGGPRE